MALRRLLLVSWCFFSLCLTGFSQTSTFSPYSRYGLGDLRFPGSVKQTGMGRTGVAVSDPDRINYLNPASLSKIDVTLVEAGAVAGIADFATENGSESANGASVNYFSLAFPVLRNRMGAALGIRPYSSAGYEVNEITESGPCNCGNLRSTFSGDGDINNYFIGAGYAPFARRGARIYTTSLYDSLAPVRDSASAARHDRRMKALSGLSFGINASWLFGTINQTRSIDVIDSTSFLDTRIERSLTLGDIQLSLAMLYDLELKNNGFLSLGAAVSPETSINARRNLLWYTFKSSPFFVDPRDTISNVVDEKGSVKLPLAWSAGLSVGKKNKWVVSASYSTQQWSRFESYGIPDSLLNSSSASAGFEYIPSYGGARFHQNVWYRMGGYYNSSYLQLNGRRINDYGITIGLGLPVLKSDHSRTMSPIYQQKAVVQFAVEAGQTGTVSDGLLRQRYIRFHLGIVFKELWFIKRKYD